MTLAEKRYRSLLQSLKADYAKAVLKGDWDSLTSTFLGVARWGNLLYASRLRYRALHQKIVVPAGEDVSLDDLADANVWIKSHLFRTTHHLSQRVKTAVDSEKRYWTTRGRELSKQSVWSVMPIRLNMFHRNILGEIQAYSEQMVMDGGLSEFFPFFQYQSACSPTSRPAHVAMHGLIAQRMWTEWTRLRPKNGYNCLCTLKICTAEEARSNGWMYGGKPSFLVKWPSRKAKTLYESGEIPDPGWDGPKFVAT